MQFEIHLLDLEFEKFEKWANKDFFDRRVTLDQSMLDLIVWTGGKEWQGQTFTKYKRTLAHWPNSPLAH